MKRVFLIAVLCLLVAALAPRLRDEKPVAATVYGRPISVEQLNDRVRPLLDSTSFKQQVGESGDFEADKRLLEQEVLSSMIKRRILAKEAQRLGVEVTAQELERASSQLRRSLALRSDERFGRYLAAQGLTGPTWRDLVHADALERELSERVRKEALPTEAELRRYYANHASRFTRTRAQHIVVGLDRGLADRLYRRLLSAPPQDLEAVFARLARRYSTDPATRKKGGRLGWVLRGSFSINAPKLDTALARVREGTVAPPIKTPYGFEIVHVLEREVAPFQRAKGRVLTEFLKQEPKDAYGTLLARAYEEAAVEVNPRYGELDPLTFQIVDDAPER